MSSPLRSMRETTSPISLRVTPSGLTRTRVRSVTRTGYRRSGRGRLQGRRPERHREAVAPDRHAPERGEVDVGGDLIVGAAEVALELAEVDVPAVVEDIP